MDDFIDLLKDEKAAEPFLERIVVLLTPIIDSMFDAKLDKKLEILNNKLDKLIDSSSRDSHQTHSQKVIDLEKTKDALSNRVDSLEAELRLDSLIFHGLQPPQPRWSQVVAGSIGSTSDVKSSNLTVAQSVIDFCKTSLDINLSSKEITSAHSLRRKGGSNDSDTILVKFGNVSTRNEIYRARLRLKKTSHQSENRIFINENLTPKNAQIFASTRKLRKEGRLFATWTFNCAVYIRITDSKESLPKKITSMDDLHQLSSAVGLA